MLARSVRAHALGARAANVVDAVRRAAGVYGSAPTCHLSLQARTSGFTPGALEDAIHRTRDLVRVHAMRGSVYLMPREHVFHALALGRIRSIADYAKGAGIDVKQYAPLTARIEEIVAEKPCPAAGIREALGGAAPDGTGLSAILGRMGREGRIVRARVLGGARSQNYEYAHMAGWIGVPDERPSPAEALRTLAVPWMLANGPATAADLAWWAGVSQRDAKAALAAIGARPAKVNGIETEMLATARVLDELAIAPQDDGEVHLLPCWDAYVMSHGDRSRYLDPELHPRVLDRMGNMTNVVLHAGRIAGIWDVDGATLLYLRFAPLPARALKAAAGRLAPLRQIDAVREVTAAPPLRSLPKNAFLAPLAKHANSVP